MLNNLVAALAAHEELKQVAQAQARADKHLAKLPKKDTDELKLKQKAGGK